jgi:cathepsin B
MRALTKHVAKLMLAFVFVADAQQPVKRQLVLDVMAKRDLRVTRTDARGTSVLQESTGTVALDFKGLRSATTTIVVQGTKHETTMTDDYGSFNTTLTESFFNERVCFKQKLLKVHGETPRRMFESAAVNALHYEYYNRSEFGGLAPAPSGQLAEYWSFNKTLTLRSKVHFPDGGVYHMKSKVNQTYSYLIAAPPAKPTILRYALANSIYETFSPSKTGQRPRDPIAFTTLAHLDYSEVVTPAPDSAFLPGAIAAPCDDLRPHNDTDGESWRREAAMAQLDGGMAFALLHRPEQAFDRSGGDRDASDGVPNGVPDNALDASVRHGTRLPIAPLLGRPITRRGASPVAARPSAGSATIALEYAIPSAFDVRTAWPQCASLVGHIRNQGRCGSCWAFSATEVIADRACIESGGAVSKLRSPAWLTQCDTTNGGCDGGYLDNAWAWLQAEGVAADSCDPYVVCPNETALNCSSSGGVLPRKLLPNCPQACVDGSKPSLLKAKAIYPVGIPGDVEAIQREMMARGSVQAAFFVFSDFAQYRGGVYRRSPGTFLEGGHAVKLLGWGEDPDGTKWWRVANSWSPAWGEQGTFRMLRGTDDCGIESTVAAGTVII